MIPLSPDTWVWGDRVRGHGLWRFLGLLTASVAAVASAAVPAGAARAPGTSATPGWRVALTLPGASQFVNVVATGASDAWVSGFSCTGQCAKPGVLVEHWNGHVWRPVPVPAGSGQIGDVLAADSASDVWVFGVIEARPTATALHWTGQGWAAPFRFPPNTVIGGAVAPAAGDAWAFGSSAKAPYAARYAGGKWTTVASFPVFGYSASAISASDIWVLGPPASGTGLAVARWNGTMWRRGTLPGIVVPKGGSFMAARILTVSPSSVWAMASIAQPGAKATTVLLHWNGTSWARVKVPAAAEYGYGLAQDGHGGVWLSASEAGTSTRLFHDSGGHWSSYPSPAPSGTLSTVNQLAWIPGTTSVWGAGLELFASSGVHGLIIRYVP